MKTIVTHVAPDLDALSSVWLVKTFLPEWEEAMIGFVPAGKTLNSAPPDGDPEVMHVDTGFGQFDHHQTDADTCAAQLVYEEIKSIHGPNEALARFTAQVNDVDHFREVFLPNPTADVWEMSIVSAIDGWRLIYDQDPLKIVALSMDLFDGVYKKFQNKIWAEKELNTKSIEFTTKWGKGVAIETTNGDVTHLAQKAGAQVVIKKDPKKGYVSIKSFPSPDIDLTTLYDRLRSDEPTATWFLHASHHMVLNGSTKNPDMKPTTRSLIEIIEVVKEVCR